jgi:hypothetical protein
MGLWSRTPAEPKEPRASKKTAAAVPTVGQGSTWTNGRALGSKLLGGVMVAAMLCGPAALVFAFTKGSTVAAADGSGQPAGISVVEQSTGSYALAYVGAWLGASRSNSTELQNYVDVSMVRNLTETAWSYRDAAVVSIAPPVEGESNIATVVVAANVEEFAASTVDDGTTQIWPRRYFQVAVTVDASTGDLGVVGLPAPIAAPNKTSVSPELVYGTQLAPTSDAAGAVTAFLGAYLAESGDIARYISPSTKISAITPAPYAALEPIDLRVDAEPADEPADGDTTRILATVSLTNALEQRLTATYALTITARADRWEVTSIDPAPQEKTAVAGPVQTTRTPAPTTTPTPSPTGDTTEGN